MFNLPAFGFAIPAGYFSPSAGAGTGAGVAVIF